jgi:plastocyanin
MRRAEDEMIRRLTLLVIAVTLPLIAGRAVAQNDRIVKGTVTLPPDSGLATDVVVYLEGTIGVPTPRKATIDQKEMTFIPHVLPVTVGSTVEFLNGDDVLHNTFSNSAAKQFDVGMFKRGESRSVTFDKPGIVELRCNVHPRMHAFVLVLENNYFATPDERGSYQIGGIPAGRYKLRAWHESLPPIETWANLDDATLRSIDLKFTR